MNSSTKIVLAFGSNQQGPWGEPAQAVLRAVDELGLLGATLSRISQLVITRPLGPAPQPDYVNAAAIGETALETEALLALIKRLEAQAGRLPGPRWGPRPLDIDIIDFGGAVRGWDVPHDPAHPAHLVLPHPEMHKRSFVLAPLAEIAPDWRHPVSGKTVGELLAALEAAPT